MRLGAGKIRGLRPLCRRIDQNGSHALFIALKIGEALAVLISNSKVPNWGEIK
jgi:hypothetical protein